MGGCTSVPKKKAENGKANSKNPDSPSSSALSSPSAPKSSPQAIFATLQEVPEATEFLKVPKDFDAAPKDFDAAPQNLELEKLIAEEAPEKDVLKGQPWLPWISAMLLFSGLILGAGLGFLAVERRAPTESASKDLKTVVDDGLEKSTQLGLCGTSSGFEWQAVSGVDPLVEQAIGHGLDLLNFARQDCEGGGFGPLQYTLSDFKQGGAGETSYIHVHHKFASTCAGETFKLHYFTRSAAEGEAANAEMSFIVEVFRDIETDAWRLLRSNPPACAISLEGIAYPEPHETTSQFVQDKAQFAVSELAFQMRSKGCLGDQGTLEIGGILSARSQIQAGLRLTFRLALKESGTSMEPKHVELIVLEKCDLTLAGMCVNELSLPSFYTDVCAPLDLETPIGLRRLSDPDRKRIGASPVDATEAHIERKQLLDPRVLSGVEKKPLKLRYIKEGAVPDHHDPRYDDCFRRITVYDQGQCGSSYATAAAQMMGLRKCLYDAKLEQGRGLMKSTGSRGFLQKDSVAVSASTSAAPALNSTSSNATSSNATSSGNSSDAAASRLLLDATSPAGALSATSPTVAPQGAAANGSPLDATSTGEPSAAPSVSSPPGAADSGSPADATSTGAPSATPSVSSPPAAATSAVSNDPSVSSSDAATSGDSTTAAPGTLPLKATPGNSSNATEAPAPAVTEPMKPRVTVHGDACLKEWQWGGYECKTYCCNPDNAPKAWCMREDMTRDPWWSFCESEEPPLCNDNMAWADSLGRGCPWYAEQEGSCTSEPDRGQLTHCQYTCRTCDDEDKDSSPDGPWHNANYKYMPSAMDLAQCTFADEGRTQQAGCDGGRFDWMWDNWLRKETRDLHVMGDKCMAYKLKCWESRNVVHSLMGSYCFVYEGYQLWHKPCSCIDQTEWPTTMTCSNETPESSCSFQIPPMAVDVMHMGHGLSNEEAVKNMQRHIIEYGPIFATFDIADDFFSWDWDKNPVYTGNGIPSDGTHAVVLCGWGTYAGTDYWLLRNSWSADWGDRGYFKLQRGVNLYNIEGDSIVATLPEAVDSHIPPYCRLKSWTRDYSLDGDFVLTFFNLEATLECDEDVSMTIELSYREDINKLERFDVQAQAGKPAVIRADLLCLGFGLLDGNLMLSWKGKDSDGEAHTVKEILLITQVPDATKFGDCGTD